MVAKHSGFSYRFSRVEMRKRQNFEKKKIFWGRTSTLKLRFWQFFSIFSEFLKNLFGDYFEKIFYIFTFKSR